MLSSENLKCVRSLRSSVGTIETCFFVQSLAPVIAVLPQSDAARQHHWVEKNMWLKILGAIAIVLFIV
jgi:hypothetical protein